MSIVVRGKQSIYGLQTHLNQLESRLDQLVDTGAITEEERTLLSHLSATKAVDLDLAVTKDMLIDNISDLSNDAESAKVSAIRQYVLGAIQVTGPNTTVETLPVYENKVTLNYKPHMGLSGIMNFSTVRFVQGDQEYNFKLTATDNPYRFLIDSRGIDINGYSVMVQYLYYYEARDINDMIGDMILNGLLLIEPETETIT